MGAGRSDKGGHPLTNRPRRTPAFEPAAYLILDRPRPHRNSKLYGYRPFQDEPEPKTAARRPRPWPAPSPTFSDALVVALSDTPPRNPTSKEPALVDHQRLPRAVGRNRTRTRFDEQRKQAAAPQARRKQDGSEIRSVELERLTGGGNDTHRTAQQHGGSFATRAADQFERHTHSAWRAALRIDGSTNPHPDPRP